MNKKLIETWFPVKEISRDAEIEMSYKSIPAYIKHVKELGISDKVTRDFFDPKIRNLHPWFARRPCSVARAITLASFLDANIEKNKFLEKKMVGGMILGGDFFELKGVVDFVLEKIGIAGVWYDSFEATSEDSQQEVWHPTKIAEIKVDHQEIGFLGEISPLLREKYGIESLVFAFELDFEKLEKMANEELEYEEISPFPAAIRDISVIVPQQVRTDEVLEKIQFISPLIRDVDLFDIFEEIGENKKSLSFHIYFQSKSKTLSDKELDFLQEKIIKTLEKNKGWKVRKKEE